MLHTTSDNLDLTLNWLGELANDGESFVCYRLPYQSSITFMGRGEVVEIADDLERQALDQAFVWQPFDRQEKAFALKSSFKIDLPFSPISTLSEGHDNWYFPESEKFGFLELVGKAKAAIEAGQFDKVVLSRCTSWSASKIDPLAAFHKAALKYPHAFAYCLYWKQKGETWIGVSPEPLALIDDKGKFQTVALAGTRKLSKALETPDNWDEKNSAEQAVVRDYIVQSLTSSAVNKVEVSDVESFQAGPVEHLINKIGAEIRSRELFWRVVGKLHPTPAVCGWPLKESSHFISRFEGYDRSLYAGYLGPVYKTGNTSLFVNLRCLRYSHLENVVTLFAGCGINTLSVPENEWEETVLKMETMLSLFSLDELQGIKQE